MLGVLSGFSVVWAVILVGYFVGKKGILGEDGRSTLNRLTFFIASPALLFQTLAASDPLSVLGPLLWVALISALLIMFGYMLVTKWWLKRNPAERMVGAMSAATVNSANLGMPIAIYVLGDIGHAAPVILFQLAILTPLNLAMLEAATSKYPTTVRSIITQSLRNPMIASSFLGLIVAFTGIQIPALIADPIALLAGASIPAMLLAFGISLVDSRPLAKTALYNKDVVVASLFKLILHPVLAWAIAAFIFRLEGPLLLSAIVMASLPTAQNVYVNASRYGSAVQLSKDTVLITTLGAIPAMIVVAVLFQ
ncbi:AEC family transporter [Neomicrococcus aestuarii]|uniref:AEC family transporter n=1 Tax=Neomicrococcus aestuarii TaxID=556325 RepID=A0A1L2ZPI1_9MICC|nr:AEC family transporter [Neomicrococcus aestuarii]APF41335.1 hypothetical protein BHE16_10410 [Neomicrococcus aestuarii]MBB5513261.1 hypothetical protein [Neomicrococcus aestuarii]